MEMMEISEVLRKHSLWLNGEDGGARAYLSDANLSGAYLSGANLSGANLGRANLEGANLDFSAWPLWCGGTNATLDRRLSLQLIYHAFNNNHTDPDIVAALEPLRALAQEFIDKHRRDAPELRGK